MSSDFIAVIDYQPNFVSIVFNKAQCLYDFSDTLVSICTGKQLETIYLRRRYIYEKKMHIGTFTFQKNVKQFGITRE